MKNTKRLSRFSSSSYFDGSFTRSRRLTARGGAKQHVSNLEQLEPRQLLAGDLMISEFLARNDGGLRDGNGRSSDWIEIFNGTDAAIDLQGYRLTDTAEDLSQWVFPNAVIEPGQSMVVFASGSEVVDYVDDDGNLHTNFTLRRGGEYLALVAPDNSIVSQYGSSGTNYPEQLANVSFGVAQSVTLIDAASPSTFLVPSNGDIDGTWQQIDFDAAANGFVEGTAAIGFEGDPDGRTNFVGQFDTTLPPGPHAVYARIPFELNDASAVSSLMMRVKVDNGFIAYLNGQRVAEQNAPANPGWFSTAPDSAPRDSVAVEFVDFDLNPHVEYLVDGTNVLALQGLNHLNDKSDLLLVTELVAGASNLEDAVGQPVRIGYLSTPSPGGPNPSSAEIFSGFVEDTKFNAKRGFYTEPQQVEITTATEGARIFYTTDGSDPGPENPNAIVYSGPVTISSTTPLRAAAFKDGFLPTNIDTQSYIFLEDVVKQDEQFTLDAGFPARWGNTAADYGLDSDVIDAVGHDAMVASLQSLPTLTITLNNDELFASDGIYTRATASGLANERATSFELIHPDGSEGFQIDAGLRMQGGAFRSHGLTLKHSFRLLFKSEYGAGKLEYPMFGDDAVDQFDTLTLRMESNDGWQWNGAGGQPQYARDEFHRRTQRAMGQPSPHGNYYHLYINGVYWGLYNAVERPDESFGAAYFGSEKAAWDGFNAAFDRGSAINSEGDRDKAQRAVDAWRTMIDLTREIGDARTEEDRTTAFQRLQGNLPDGTNDPNQEDFLDVDNYIDYLIVNHWGANTDWPFKNFYVGRENSPDSTGFKFFSWDAEWTLTLRGSVTENRLNDDRGLQAPLPDLRESEEFRVLFGDHVHRHFFNGGALYVDPQNPEWDPMQPDRNVPAARYVRITEEIYNGLLAESARWGDQHRSTRPYTRDVEWQQEFDKLMRTWFPQRSQIVLEDYVQAGLYPEVAAPVFNQQGGAVPSGFVLTMDNPGSEGTLYYTLDGSDPRKIGGSVADNALIHDGQPLPLDGNVRVKSRVLSGGEWSALHEGEFFIADVRITEINYHPHTFAAADGMGQPVVDPDDSEFIELTNVSSQEIDVTGFAVTRGVDFTFPENTTIGAGQRVVLVSSQDGFRTRYGGDHRIIGQYDGRLSNDGERLQLSDSQGNVLSSIDYRIDGAWPTRANGRGSSLEIVDPLAPADSASNWQASVSFGGSPSAGSDTGRPIIFNEILAGSQTPLGDMVELRNTGGSAIDLGSWYVSDTDDNFLKYRIPSGTVIATQGYSTFSEADMGFGFSRARGGNIWLVEADSAGRPLRFVASTSFGPTPDGFSIGPWPDVDSPLLPLSQPSFGQPNPGPLVGDVVISEIHYNPIDPDGDRSLRARDFKFVELHNRSANELILTDWQLTGSVQYDFEDGFSIGAGETIVLVPFNVSTGSRATVFGFQFGVPDGTRLIRYTGDPDDETTFIRLERPGLAAEDNPSFVPTLVVDQVDYDRQRPWPPAMIGTSLTRISPSAYGDIPTSWVASEPSPGRVDLVMRHPGDANEDGQFDQLDITAVLQADKYLTGEPASFSQGDWNGDGVFDPKDLVQALQAGTYLQGPLAARRGVALFASSNTAESTVDWVFGTLGAEG